MNKLPLIAIVGPTSCGKTSFSIELAKAFRKSGITCEIVSADSRQVYKGLDLLSGKTERDTKASAFNLSLSTFNSSGIPHHMLGVVSLKKKYSVSEYKKGAEKIIGEIHSRGHLPILVGGTGFYIDALTKGIILPEVPPNKKLRARLVANSAIANFATLMRLDPKRAQTIDQHNNARLIRAIEIATALGKVPKVQIKQKYNVVTLGINLSDIELKKRIHTRLLERMSDGMIKEAEKLHKSGVLWKRMEELGLECRYVALYLQKKIAREVMLSELEMAIWHYAKRQRTWFKRDKEIFWIS